jgi:hypothetical protein
VENETTGQVTLVRGVHERVHTSHAETVERHYDRCRKEGMAPDVARQVATDAADRNHRTWDARKRSE